MHINDFIPFLEEQLRNTQFSGKCHSIASLLSEDCKDGWQLNKKLLYSGTDDRLYGIFRDGSYVIPFTFQVHLNTNALSILYDTDFTITDDSFWKDKINSRNYYIIDLDDITKKSNI